MAEALREGQTARPSHEKATSRVATPSNVPGSPNKKHPGNFRGVFCWVCRDGRQRFAKLSRIGRFAAEVEVTVMSPLALTV